MKFTVILVALAAAVASAPAKFNPLRAMNGAPNHLGFGTLGSTHN